MADVGNGRPLQIGCDGADGSSLGQQLWDFNLSNLSADLTNLGGIVVIYRHLIMNTVPCLISSSKYTDLLDLETWHMSLCG